MFSLLLSVVNIKDQYKFNSAIHNTNSRQNCNLHHTSSNLTTHKEATYYYFGIKVFNKVSSHTKIMSQIVKLFKSAYKNLSSFKFTLHTT